MARRPSQIRPAIPAIRQISVRRHSIFRTVVEAGETTLSLGVFFELSFLFAPALRGMVLGADGGPKIEEEGQDVEGKDEGDCKGR
jgi:hypothetical protein